MSDLGALLAAAFAVVYETVQHPASCQVAGPGQMMHGQTAPVCTCGLTNALIDLETLAPALAREVLDRREVGEELGAALKDIAMHHVGDAGACLGGMKSHLRVYTGIDEAQRRWAKLRKAEEERDG